MSQDAHLRMRTRPNVHTQACCYQTRFTQGCLQPEKGSDSLVHAPAKNLQPRPRLVLIAANHLHHAPDACEFRPAYPVMRVLRRAPCRVGSPAEDGLPHGHRVLGLPLLLQRRLDGRAEEVMVRCGCGPTEDDAHAAGAGTMRAASSRCRPYPAALLRLWPLALLALLFARIADRNDGRRPAVRYGARRISGWQRCGSACGSGGEGSQNSANTSKLSRVQRKLGVARRAVLLPGTHMASHGVSPELRRTALVRNCRCAGCCTLSRSRPPCPLPSSSKKNPRTVHPRTDNKARHPRRSLRAC